jgi:hypothetical protein
MPITSFSCFGPALVYVATYTDNVINDFELLGYTDHGVRMRVVKNISDIITDVYGPMTPHDLQDMGMIANIQVPLIASDRLVLNSILNPGNRTQSGNINTPGLVLGANSNLFAVGITSDSLALAGQVDDPWVFFYCMTRPGFDTTLATRANPFTMEFFGFPWSNFDNTEAYDTPLFGRTFVP